MSCATSTMLQCQGDEPEACVPDLPVEALFSSLYAELCRLARREVRRNGAPGFVGTQTVVHEAWFRIGRQTSLAFSSNGRFLAYAARVMRGLVVDRVRSQYSQKRGGEYFITSLGTDNADQIAQPEYLEELSDTLDELARLEPVLANVVELRFFCGFSLAEIAVMQDCSERTVQRQWEKARLLMYRSLNPT